MMRGAMAAIALTACAFAQQSAVDPASHEAGRINTLFWFFLWLLTAVFIIVLGFTITALFRRHRGIEQEPLEQVHLPPGPTEKRLTRAVTAATLVTVAILFVLLVLSVQTGRGIAGPAPNGKGIAIEVTGNQWWWYVRYLNDDPRKVLVTANEIHVPVGRQVMIRGTSHDVIHSFWVPSLEGKRDLIPSRITALTFQADRPGRFRGQCAEFCGLQHANMALWVVAEPEDKFEAWLNAQLQPAPQPTDPYLLRGQQVFMNNACVLCHSIQGTPAAGQVAPDLTHVGSRISIAAGTLWNSKGNLAGWIADPQNIKPGNHMAVVLLKPGELEPLVDYLESLK